MEAPEALILSPKDNVATSLKDAPPGTVLKVYLGRDARTVKTLDRVPFGFKVAIADIAHGSNVMKYGEPIGVASTDIKAGQLVHIHNIEGARGRGDLEKGGRK
jgi:altronate dehydratase small subunit